MTTEPTTDPRDAELAALRARVAELEIQLAEQTQATTRIVAEAQEKLYWLERWHVDLDRVMAKPGAIPALNTLRRVRQLVWSIKRRKRLLLGR